VSQKFTEGPAFSSKRKEELLKLLDTPVFTETAIRFRLPDGRIIQSHFSPIEKVHHLREEISKVEIGHSVLQPGTELVLVHHTSSAEA
jgi:hypothetical protein